MSSSRPQGAPWCSVKYQSMVGAVQGMYVTIHCLVYIMFWCSGHLLSEQVLWGTKSANESCPLTAGLGTSMSFTFPFYLGRLLSCYLTLLHSLPSCYSRLLCKLSAAVSSTAQHALCWISDSASVALHQPIGCSCVLCCLRSSCKLSLYSMDQLDVAIWCEVRNCKLGLGKLSIA